MNRKFQRSDAALLDVVLRAVAVDLAVLPAAALVAPKVLSNFFNRSLSLKCVGDLNES